MFYITISNGLLKDGHRKRMGEAIWEFMWCIDRVTKIDEDGKGYVLGGKPVNLCALSVDMGVHETTVSRNLNKLKRQGYLTLRHTPYGIVLIVHKTKKSFSKNAGRFSKDAKSFSGNAKPNIRHYKDTTKTVTSFKKTGDGQVHSPYARTLAQKFAMNR